jgi:hypothetical protein
MVATPVVGLRLLILGSVATLLGACATDTAIQVVASDTPTKVASTSSHQTLVADYGVPPGMMRTDGTMINGLLPIGPYY